MAQRTAPALSLAKLHTQLLALWPAAKGSLSQVRKPCIHPGCRRCASGQKHPTWLLSCSLAGRRRCLYVPPAAVPALRAALARGRRVEQLLVQAAIALRRDATAKER